MSLFDMLKIIWEEYGLKIVKSVVTHFYTVWPGSLLKGCFCFVHFLTHLFQHAIITSWAQEHFINLLVNALRRYSGSYHFWFGIHSIHLTHGWRQCGFFRFILLEGPKGKLAVLFWESASRNVEYSTWGKNVICQIDKVMVNENGNNCWLQILKWQKNKKKILEHFLLCLKSLSILWGKSIIFLSFKMPLCNYFR